MSGCTGTDRRAIAGAILAIALLVTCAAGARAQEPEHLADGVALALGGRRLELHACRDDVVRVLDAAPGAFFARRSIATVADACRPTPFEVKPRPDGFELATKRLVVRVRLPEGRLAFLDRDGRTLLAEKEGGGRTITPAEVMGEKTAHVQAAFEHYPGEAFYGLGAHQNGLMDYAGRDLDLYQLNIVDVVPFLVSSRGYGLLWDNTSQTKFGDTREPVHVPAANLYDADGRQGGLTGTYRQGDCASGTVVATRADPQLAFGAPEDRPAISAIHNTPQVANPALHPKLATGEACVTWDGAIEFERPGAYDLMTFANNGVRVWLDGRLLFGTWRQGWLPWWDEARLTLDAPKQRHKLRVEWHRDEGEGTLRLKWKTPPRSPDTSLSSEVGDGIDYYVVYGPELGDVVAGYRKLTGTAPLMPRWALGLWQSRERYKTAKEVTDTLAEFRKRGIPLDTIVMDWQYWKPDQWGSHQFDPERFPDPAGWIKEIHERWNAKLMISVWPKFYTTTDNFKAMQAKGFLYPETLKRPTTDWLGHVHTFYDAFNPDARTLFWQQVNEALFSKGIDAWWLDSTEPELVGEGTPGALKAAMNPTALGSGARMANAYVVASSQTFYEGQRAADPKKRVFILTRSAFAGSQRYAAATWSGDVSSDWDSLRRQVPAGLNMALSGIPWWTTDVGGFATPRKWARQDPKPEDVEEWRELVTRWFQYATFCPLLRVHGQFPYREMWNVAGEEHKAYKTQLAFDKPPLPHAALHLLARGGRDAPRRDADAAAGGGVPGRSRHERRGRRVPARARPAREPRRGAGRHAARGLPAARPVARRSRDRRRLVRLLDRRLQGGRPALHGAGALRVAAGVRARRLDPADGPGAPVRGREAGRPAHALGLHRPRRELRALRGRRRELRLRAGTVRDDPARLGRGEGRAHGRRAQRLLPGMLAKRQLRVVFVSKDAAVPHSATPEPAASVAYDGTAIVIPRKRP